MSWLDRTRTASAADGKLLDRDLVEFVSVHQPRLVRLAALVCHNDPLACGGLRDDMRERAMPTSARSSWIRSTGSIASTRGSGATCATRRR
jgi:hypothetical protein